MKRILALSLVVCAAHFSARAQGANQPVELAIGEGAWYYNHDDLAAAQKHLERAVALDPKHPKARIYLARVIHRQYKPEAETAENRAKAQQAIEAYKKVLEHDPQNQEAFAQVADLYRRLAEYEKEEAWHLQRASNPSAQNKKRSDAYAVLAGRRWSCSQLITEQEANKETQGPADKIVIRYKMPRSRDDFEKARACVMKGLEYVEQAILLNPENTDAWSHKANLLHERAKLSEMEDDARGVTEYSRQADEAEDAGRKLLAQAEREKEAEPDARLARDSAGAGRELTAPGEFEAIPPVADAAAPVAPQHEDATPSRSKPTPSSSGPVGPTSPDTSGGQHAGASEQMKIVISAGTLEGRVVSKPQPPYPPVARAARASGVVVVEVMFDEEGKVISARAVSGHPLLQPAAVAAARAARFKPVLLEGRPIKVQGIITYNFTLR